MTTPPPAPVNAVLTITVKDHGSPGLLVGLKSTGDYSDEVLDRLFYSLPQRPDATIPPLHVWGVILREIARYLLTWDAPLDAGPPEQATQ